MLSATVCNKIQDFKNGVRTNMNTNLDYVYREIKEQKQYNLKPNNGEEGQLSFNLYMASCLILSFHNFT